MNTVTVNTAATKNTQFSKIEKLDAEILRLNTLEESIKNQIAEISKTRTQMVDKINELPKYLNVTDLEEAFQLIKAIRNIAEHSNVAPVEKSEYVGIRGKRIFRRVVNEVIELLKTNEFTTAQIAEKINVSASSVNNIKKAAGLVKARHELVKK